MSIKVTSELLKLVGGLGLLGGFLLLVHKSGHVHERHIIKKEAEAAAERAADAVEEIEINQEKIEPIVVAEKEVIIKQDLAAVRKLGEVEGQLKAIRKEYEHLIESLDTDWADADLPDGVREQITKIDHLISGL